MLSILELQEIKYHSSKNVLRMEVLSILYWFDMYYKYKTDEYLFDKPITEVKFETISVCRENLADMIEADLGYRDKEFIIDMIKFVTYTGDYIDNLKFFRTLKFIKRRIVRVLDDIDMVYGDYDQYFNNVSFALQSLFPLARNLFLTAENYGLIHDATIWYRLENGESVTSTVVEKEVKFASREIKKALRK